MSYDKNCLMVDTPISNWHLLNKVIDKNDLYKPEEDRFGLEKEPHITILYGISPEVSLDELKSKVNLPPINNLTYSIRKLDCFEQETYDVLKFTITSGALTDLNYEIRESVPYESDFPDYKPHMTIAYLKKGMAAKYLSKYNKIINKISVPHSYLYSTADDKKFTFIN